MTQALGITQIGRFDFSPILAGDFPKVTNEVILATGSVYQQGSVLGKVTASGLCVLVNSANSDGSEKPYAVLAETVDATTVEAKGVAWLTGEFARAHLIFGGSDAWETHEQAAREVSIFFKETRQAPNE